jgi:hypothetical protein
MGLLGKLEKREPPTGVDEPDPEKAGGSGTDETGVQEHHLVTEPKVEASMRRKLDLRFTPLVAWLCESRGANM